MAKMAAGQSVKRRTVPDILPTAYSDKGPWLYMRLAINRSYNAYVFYSERLG